MNERTIRIAGWSAYANGVLTLVNLVTLSLMFAVNPVWGPVNDAVSVVWLLSFLPLVWLFAGLNRPVIGRSVSVAIAAMGAGAILAFAALQSLLVVGLVRFEQTFAAVATLGGIMGLWLLVSGLLAVRGSTLPHVPAWLTAGFGLSYVLGMIGYWLGGYESPILWLGAIAGYVVGPVWAFWLGRLLLHGRVPATTFDRAGSIQV